MEEINSVSIDNTNIKKRSWIWMWVVIGVILFVVLFFVFRGSEKTVKGNGEVTPPEKTDDISNLDIGENPDLGVDDFNSLQISQEEITS